MQLLENLDALSLSELNSLLLEVFRNKTSSLTGADVLRSFRDNRFVAPSAVDPIAFLEMELALLKHARSCGLSPVELSPLAPMGSCSAVALADQNKIVSALRGTEVLADATNVLALHAALQRKHACFDTTAIHFCSAARHVRAQSFSSKGFSAHFKIFCVVSAGKDNGSFSFEKQTMTKHLSLYKDYLQNIIAWKDFRFVIKSLKSFKKENVQAVAVADSLKELLHNVDHVFEDVPEEEHSYYNGVRFSINIVRNGSEINIGDGGFVDWGSKLTGSKKERMLTSGLGTELLYKILNGMI